MKLSLFLLVCVSPCLPLCLSAPASACSRFDVSLGRAPTLAEDYGSAQSVFRARITRVQPARRLPEDRAGMVQAQFETLEIYKGRPPSYVRAPTGTGILSCSLYLKPGLEYVFFTHEQGNVDALESFGPMGGSDSRDEEMAELRKLAATPATRAADKR